MISTMVVHRSRVVSLDKVVCRAAHVYGGGGVGSGYRVRVRWQLGAHVCARVCRGGGVESG